MTSSVDFVPSRIKSTDPLHEPWLLTAEQREVFRERSRASRAAREAALSGRGADPIHRVNVPVLDPFDLMPALPRNGLPALSLFSGGGGLDLGFDRAGFQHAGSWEILDDAAQTLRQARPAWEVHGGADGDVRGVDWRRWRGEIGIVHGGPPCQPFSHAGKQRGATDPRDMWPEFVRAVLESMPEAFVAENVSALATARFASYVDKVITQPLSTRYTVRRIALQAYDFGVPQARRRVVFVGFKSPAAAQRWRAPAPTHRAPGTLDDGRPEAMGMRQALGLPDIGRDGVCPTIRSGLTGPRHTTSILNSVSAKRKFEDLQVWPNGVAATRQAARAFVAKNGHFRLSVPDVALLQGFPGSWEFSGAVYMRLGQIGNAVAPPVGYAVARSVAQALLR
ncbi:MAG: DNA (cytosine-5-)-methyltransferase [Bifidobacteriaceae bacterium]|jgi:DNA (cytosine-5)-methyltransferase 1|nr:DNA (cytosine-5-)-methyltransferase [Bifidobacteriaceae bacterium]